MLLYHRPSHARPRASGYPNPAMALRIRLGAAAFAIAGVLFVLYPAIRPFSDEVSLEGAEAFGSSSWIVAHMLAMVGFTVLMVGLLGWYLVLSRAAESAPSGLCWSR